MDLDVHGGGEKAVSTLRSKAVSGIKWSAVSQAGRQATQLVTTVILARLLSPADFGLVGMALVVTGFVNIFKDLGTSAAIIQQKELSEDLLPSIFWINIGFGLAATLVLFLLAPWISLYYQEPRVAVVLQVLAPGFFISGLGILHQALLERSLSFNTLARLEVISALAGAVIGIALAFLNAGVWSLVFQSLGTAFFITGLLWLSSPWRPRWTFHWKEVKAVSRFSLNLTGFSIFNYFARNADYLLIGRYLGAQELGYYTLAYRILLFPIQNITAVIGRVLYPVLSTFQDDNQRFSSAYLKVTASIALVSFPLMLGVMALARPFILTLFGQRWEPVILLVTILAPVGLVQSIGSTVGAIYQSKGRTDWMFRWGLVAGVLVMIAFVIGLRWGTTGVAVAYALATGLLFYPSFAVPFRLTELKFVQMVRLLTPPFFNSVFMLVALLILRFSLPASLPNLLVLMLCAAGGVTTYIMSSWFTNQDQIKELWEITRMSGRKLNEAG